MLSLFVSTENSRSSLQAAALKIVEFNVFDGKMPLLSTGRQPIVEAIRLLWLRGVAFDIVNSTRANSSGGSVDLNCGEVDSQCRGSYWVDIIGR